MALTLPPTVDSYRISAKHYDGAYGAIKDLVDTQFYRELARQYGGPVLEDRVRHGPSCSPWRARASEFMA